MGFFVSFLETSSDGPTVRLLLSVDAIVQPGDIFLGLSPRNILQELVDCTQTKNVLAFNEYRFLFLPLQLSASLGLLMAVFMIHTCFPRLQQLELYGHPPLYYPPSWEPVNEQPPGRLHPQDIAKRNPTLRPYNSLHSGPAHNAGRCGEKENMAILASH